MFVLSAYRAAYLPRTPPEKSISGTFAVGVGLSLFFEVFFILLPLASVGFPGADDAKGFFALCMTHN